MIDIPANAKYAIIRETSQRTDNLLSIEQLCSLAGMPRSGYYHYLSREEDQLMERYSPSLQAQVLIHSDQGAHYTSVKLAQLAKDSQLRQLMSPPGQLLGQRTPGELLRPHEG